MLNSTTVILLNIILIPATILHIYWILGGEKVLDIALPFNYNDKKKSLGKSLYYTLGILSLAPVITMQILMLYLINDIPTPYSNFKELILLGSSIFCILRAIIGWSLKNKVFQNTTFQNYNIKVYSPIFLILGLGFMILGT